MWILDTDHLSLLQRENSQLIERLSLHQDRVVITIVTAEEQLRGRLSGVVYEGILGLWFLSLENLITMEICSIARTC